MIIGISGKIGSGKDTVGMIIQYLVANSKHPQDKPSFNILQQDKFQQQNAELISNYNIKKFADTLKDIVCLLINCTREQLEDADFKNTELGEEWWFNHIVPEHGFGSKLINWDKDLKPQKLTPRLLLQLLGTECGRNIIHPNVWVNALFSKYKEEIYRSAVPTRAAGYIDQYSYPNWIITDMRFPNELEAVKSRGGISIRVNRYLYNLKIGDSVSYIYSDEIEKIETIEHKVWDKHDNPNERCKINGLYVNYSDIIIPNQHPSETALDNAEFDYTIDNNGTIEELIEKVKELLIKEKII